MLKPTHNLPPMLKASLTCLLVKSVVYSEASMQIPVFSVPAVFRILPSTFGPTGKQACDGLLVER
jgi:hypothetical protein